MTGKQNKVCGRGCRVGGTRQSIARSRNPNTSSLSTVKYKRLQHLRRITPSERLKQRLRRLRMNMTRNVPPFLALINNQATRFFSAKKPVRSSSPSAGRWVLVNQYFMAGLIEQDIQQERSVIVIDPHGSLVRHVVARMPEERLDDVYLLDLASENAVGLNLFACPQPRTMQTMAATANSISHVFEKVFGTSVDRTPRLLGVLRAITRLLIDNDLTMAEIPLLFSNDALRAKMVASCSSSSIVSFWEGYNRRSQRDKDDLVAVLP